MVSAKKRTVPVGDGGAATSSLDQSTDVWAPFTVPDNPRVRVSRTSNDSHRFSKWCIDTGANVVVTSPEDTSVIVTTLLGTDSLDTTGGPVSVQKALLRTPAGLCEGLLSPGSPRILPGMELSRYRLFVCVGGQAFIKGCDGKLVECPVHEDIPYLPEDMQISAWP